MSNRQGIGVLFGLVGVVVIIGGIRGTWRRVWSALTTDAAATGDSGAGDSAGDTSIGAFTLPWPGSGGGGGGGGIGGVISDLLGLTGLATFLSKATPLDGRGPFEGRDSNAEGHWTAKSGHIGSPGPRFIRFNVGGNTIEYHPDKDTYRFPWSTHKNAESVWNRYFSWVEAALVANPNADVNQVMLSQLARLRRVARQQGIPLDRTGFIGLDQISESWE
jgi:hypothetical protein